MKTRLTCACAGLCVVLGAPVILVAQQHVPPQHFGGPLTGPAVLDAPFSAEAVTTVRQTLADGTRIERTATARYYRDRMGRVRVEQDVIGLETLGLNPDRHVMIALDPDPEDAIAYFLDPQARTAGPAPRSLVAWTVAGPIGFTLPVAPGRYTVFPGSQKPRSSDASGTEQPLGTRRLDDGIEVTGRRVTATIPAGTHGNDRPLQITYERWESPELKLLVYSRSVDPRTGVVEYQLRNIRRAEPSPDLFIIPADYVMDASKVYDGHLTLEPGRRDPRSRNKRPQRE